MIPGKFMAGKLFNEENERLLIWVDQRWLDVGSGSTYPPEQVADLRDLTPQERDGEYCNE